MDMLWERVDDETPRAKSADKATQELRSRLQELPADELKRRLRCAGAACQSWTIKDRLVDKLVQLSQQVPARDQTGKGVDYSKFEHIEDSESESEPLRRKIDLSQLCTQAPAVAPMPGAPCAPTPEAFCDCPDIAQGHEEVLYEAEEAKMPSSFERVSEVDTDEADEADEADEVEEAYKGEREPRILEAVDVDGWKLEPSQMDLVEETDDDLQELKLLLGCCRCAPNRARLRLAIQEFEVKLRVRRTWAWFPLTRFQWSGFEFEKPVIVLDFPVPGAGRLPREDVVCDFGRDWFDLKVWNVEWPEDPGVKYHHRVKKTRLMRDIVPSESSSEAKGDHVYVKLKKVLDPTHGYCAWPDLAAGKGRKPFRYQEDAPDGGLMNFLEGEYEKYEGYDGFRLDVGRAMEHVHRGQPVSGFD